MNIRIIPNQLHGVITTPQSKSICHRALICAALGDKPMRLNISKPAYDVSKTIDSLRAFGAVIEAAEDHIVVTPPKNTPKKAMLDCGGSNSTLRFTIPLAASLGIECEITGTSNLSVEHISSLIETLNRHGCKFSCSSLPYKLSGKIKNGDFYIPASESSQFTSGLIMGLARTQGDSKVVLLPPVNSKRYVDLTVNVLNKFGCNIEHLKDGYLIHGSEFSSPDQFTPEGDFASASIWLSCGVAVKGLPETTMQADDTVIDVLVSMGALIFRKDDELHCDINNLHSFCLHASQFPDIVPSLCAAAATAKGITHITGVEKLHFRDVDRIKGICDLINGLGGNAKAFDNDIVIQGVTKLKGGEALCCKDHRLIFAAAIMSCKCENPVIINDAEHVNKSYSNFWDDFKSVGGIYEEI